MVVKGTGNAKDVLNALCYMTVPTGYCSALRYRHRRVYSCVPGGTSGRAPLPPHGS